jgi:hypothetical protein
MFDFSKMYGEVYAVFGVPATLIAGTGEVTLTVIDDTRPKTNIGGSVEIVSVGPGAFVRMPELTENGIARDDLVDSGLTFNGRNWKVLASEPRGSPNGEDVGELRLLLKAAGSTDG